MIRDCRCRSVQALAMCNAGVRRIRGLRSACLAWPTSGTAPTPPNDALWTAAPESRRPAGHPALAPQLPGTAVWLMCPICMWLKRHLPFPASMTQALLEKAWRYSSSTLTITLIRSFQFMKYLYRDYKLQSRTPSHKNDQAQRSVLPTSTTAGTISKTPAREMEG